MIDFENGKVIKLRRDNNVRLREVEDLLVDDEEVIGSYTAVRDRAALMFDRHGLKTETVSDPRKGESKMADKIECAQRRQQSRTV